MPARAKVGSLEAIEAFRASLVVYAAQARSALEEISSEVIRMRVWLESDQRAHWDRELRLRGRVLDEAQQALFSARLSAFSNGVALQQIAVHKARRAVEEGNVKLRVLKKWARDFEGTVQPLLKQVEKLHTLLSHDVVKAVAELSEVTTTLAAYAEMPAPSIESSTAPGESASPAAPVVPSTKQDAGTPVANPPDK